MTLTLPPELDFERLTVEEKYHRAVPGYMRRLCGVYEAMYERFGQEGLDLIRQVSTEYGASIGRNVKKKGGLKGVAEVGRYLLRVFDMVSDDWSVPEFSKDKLVIAVSRCPYPFTFPEVCEAHTCMERALVETLDEDLDYRIGRSIPKGDPYCEHILCRKGDGWEIFPTMRFKNGTRRPTGADSWPPRSSSGVALLFLLPPSPPPTQPSTPAHPASQTSPRSSP